MADSIPYNAGAHEAAGQLNIIYAKDPAAG
jgi:hypothetical protein